MSKLDLIVLSYHEFYKNFSEYTFSRTYEQFLDDLLNKNFHLVTIDDAHYSCLKALEIMQGLNHRAILFVSTSLIGWDKYLSWREIKEVSKYHEIGNHSHNHVNLQTLKPEDVQEEILTANNLIEKHTGKKPRFFVPPFNKYNNHIDNVAEKFGLQIVKNRVDILNITE